MNQNPSALFITFEGPEGSGKTTQISLLAEYLAGRGVSVLATREPGGTEIGNRIRKVVLDPEHTEMSPRTEALLYNAARAQIVDQVIQPALGQGKVVLCDRYVDSTIAYQGYGHQRPVEQLRTLGDYATGGLVPDMTLYLEIDPAAGLERKQNGALEEWNRFERRKLTYHQRVHEGYLAMAEEDPQRWRIIDASLDELTVQKQIVEQVAELMGLS